MAEWQTRLLAEIFQKQGLRAAPSQVWQGIRLVPLIDPQPVADLRLFRHKTEADYGIVSVDDDLAYYAYLPHSYILNWTPAGDPEALSGTQMQKQGGGKDIGNRDGKRWKAAPVVQFERHGQKTGCAAFALFAPAPRHRGGFTPVFNAPGIDWRDTYRRSAISEGLIPREACVLSGYALEGLETALRIFELHPGQVGLLVFVADALAMICLYPHPSDYAFLHRSLIGDLFAELFGITVAWIMPCSRLSQKGRAKPTIGWN